MTALPIFYSFRRCPYAMRARLAILSSAQCVELREIILRDKASEFLETSPSATVPCLKDRETVVDESLDIMVWALKRADPEGWLSPSGVDAAAVRTLIEDCDGPFKMHLDRYKYDTRYENADKGEERKAASEFLWTLDDRLRSQPWLFGARACLADYAILPFVRQFANVDRAWFDSDDWLALKRWLQRFEMSERFQAIMAKYPKWQAGDEKRIFPDVAGSSAFPNLTKT